MGSLNNITRLIAGTIVTILVVVFGVSMVKLKPALLPHERQLVQFNYEKVGIIERTPAVVAGISSPFSGAEDRRKDFPPLALAELVPPGEEKGGGQRISMVLIKDRVKIAIVDGVVVKEGDRFQDGMVKRIDKTGVLLKDNEGERWVTIK
ncbi:MAG TPA: hypothetical protein PLX02_12510 [Syntrophorhabdaceae bacterium]|nr:hypothetical protein [Syntrophorhabdaceae bacterium]HQM82434.1 hypothetical protein [Syntrophorhabdaceae bacterium]